MNIRIVGADPRYETLISQIVSQLPPWYVAGGRVQEIAVSNDPAVRAQLAMYRHGTRDILVAPGLGTILQRALAHEFAHAIDDWTEATGNPHFYSINDSWVAIHRSQDRFELAKYREDPKEHFADAMAKAIILGVDKFSLSCPREAEYFGRYVFPSIQNAV